MSVKAMAWVWDQDIPRDEKFVLLAYADHADHDGHNIFPAVMTIARKTGYSERSVQRITRSLVEHGWLIDDGVSSLQTNQYSIPMVGGDKLAPPSVGGAKSDIEGVTNLHQGVPKTAGGGDIAMSPEPSLTIIKPSEETEEETSSAAAFIEQLPGPRRQATNNGHKPFDLLNVLAEAVGFTALPGGAIERGEQVRCLVEAHGQEAVVSALRNAARAWVSTIGKNGRPYSILNLAWMDKAQEALMSPLIDTDRKPDTSKMTNEEWSAWIRQQAQKQDSQR